MTGAAPTTPGRCVRHVWGHDGRPAPLICLGCGVLWPGEPLPEPAHRLGPQHDPDKPSWHSRVRRMVNDPIWETQ